MGEFVKKRTWDEFRRTGMLWWCNSLLHVMGWAIVVEIDDDGKIVGVYPARVKFRGFGGQEISKGFQDVSKYMLENAQELYDESCE